MSKKIKKALVPELRFPEFEEADAWDEKPLNKISEIVMGASPKSSEYNDNGVGLPLLQGNADIKNRLSAPRIFTSKITKECVVGDILLSVRAPVGTVAKSNHNACIGRGIAAIRAGRDSNQEFIYQWLLNFEPFWSDISQGGAFDAVNSDDIRNLLTPVPEKEEQQKIADCLSSLDELITAHTQKHEVLKAHKKGLMQQLFPVEGETVPKLRFPEFRDAGEWEEKKLGDLSKILRGGSPRPIDDYMTLESTSLNWLKIADVNKEDKYVTGTKERVLVTALSKTREVNPGDLIMSNSMSFGRPYILKIKSCIHDGWIAVTEIDEQANRDYLYYLILSPESQAYFLNNAAGSGVKNLNADIIKLLPVSIPKDPNEQQKIADCLSSLDDSITAQAQKIDSLKVYKKGLMQQLFPTADEVEA